MADFSRFRFLNFNITNICDFRCKLCRIWTNKENFLTLGIERFRFILEDFSRHVRPGYLVNICGGEPLLIENLSGYVEAIRSVGMTANVTSNGFLLDRAKISELIAAGIRGFTFSIDSFDPQVHDRLRGRRGTLARVITAIATIKELDPSLQVGLCTTISSFNIDTLPALIEQGLADPMIDTIYFQIVTQPFNTEEVDRWTRDERYRSYWPEDIVKTSLLIDSIIERYPNPKLSNQIPQLQLYKVYLADPDQPVLSSACKIDHGGINLEGSGTVVNCPSLPPIGDARNNTLTKLLDSPEFAENHTRIATCRKGCHLLMNCFYLD